MIVMKINLLIMQQERWCSDLLETRRRCSGQRQQYVSYQEYIPTLELGTCFPKFPDFCRVGDPGGLPPPMLRYIAQSVFADCGSRSGAAEIIPAVLGLQVGKRKEGAIRPKERYL